ncbi:MAG TPA: protocatechuate 3,4-dioxygenase subunit beta [bacterium]|nr:protocatechuate 3,4-dioxygenase subunit beta [bacterium]
MASHTIYRRGEPGEDVPYLHPAYVSTVYRAPQQPLVVLPHTLSEITGPLFGHGSVGPLDHDLTRQHAGEPIGQRIAVSGRVTDADGRPLRDTLVEVWQCNAAGRYRHEADQHDAPLDPNFSGAGRTATDQDGVYRFITIEPGAYPWGNHYNGWRPRHIHFSLFGTAFATRLVTQMFFPGDPLLPLDPIYNAVPDVKARERLVSSFDLDSTVPGISLGYRFDIVLRGRDATPMEA